LARARTRSHERGARGSESLRGDTPPDWRLSTVRLRLAAGRPGGAGVSRVWRLQHHACTATAHVSLHDSYRFRRAAANVRGLFARKLVASRLHSRSSSISPSLSREFSNLSFEGAASLLTFAKEATKQPSLITLLALVASVHARGHNRQSVMRGGSSRPESLPSPRDKLCRRPPAVAGAHPDWLPPRTSNRGGAHARTPTD
jgi:hypothetical protein